MINGLGNHLYTNLRIKQIETAEARPFILDLHYAQRMPSVSYAYGLYYKDKLSAVMTIGKPASHSLCIGICGEEYAKQVYELNRLIALPDLPENSLSYFMGQVMKDLKDTDLIIVSYADEGAYHHGYIYQATNWWYTGKTKQRTDKYTPKNKHSRHYDRSGKYDHLRKVRTSKYRYVYVPNKRLRKKVKKLMNYPIIEDYPKGDNKPYKLGTRIKTIILNRKTGETYRE